jgi:hypothetical protein
VISGKNKSIMAPSYQNNSVIQWLKQKNCWVPPNLENTQAAVTHYLMCPFGKANILEAKFKEFLEVYANYISMTEKPSLGIVEKHGPVFNLFFDLDVKVSCVAELESVRGKVQELLLTVYTTVGATSEMVVCTCKPYKPNKSLEYRKCGLHLHWPGLQVDTALAMSHRQACMEACEKVFGPELAAGRSWAEVFDHTVLQPGRGLRMIASTKEASSPATVYLPKYVVKVGMLEEVQNPYLGFYSWLVKTRISVIEEEHSQDISAGRRVASGASYGTHQSLQHHKELLDAIRACIDHEEFQGVRFTKLIVYQPADDGNKKSTWQAGNKKARGGKKGRRPAHAQPPELPKLVVGLDSRRCLNLKGTKSCHSNNHVYALVTAEGIWQKCHNDNPTHENRRFCPCPEFRVKIGDVDNSLRGMLEVLLLDCPSTVTVE